MISFLILLAAVASLLALARRLPVQNLVAMAVLILLSSGGIEALAFATGFPFHIFEKYEVVFLFGIVPWPAPALWMIFLLQARNLAQFLLRSQRQKRFYGFWLLGLVSLFTAAFWAPLELALSSPSVWANFPGRFFTALGISILIFPWTLDKRRCQLGEAGKRHE